MLAQFIHPLEKRKVEACVCSEMGIFGGAGMDLVQLKTLGADISFGKAQGLGRRRRMRCGWHPHICMGLMCVYREDVGRTML